MNIDGKFFEELFRISGISDKPVTVKSVAGGCINRCFHVSGSNSDYFIKINNASYNDMFNKEAIGLDALAKVDSLKVPRVLAEGRDNNLIYLILEYITPGYPSNDYWKECAQGLAKVHNHSSDTYGFYTDNYIGSLKQVNKASSTWIDFFISYRLQYQLDLAMNAGKVGKEILESFNKLYNKLSDILPVEKPSLLHGDLWSGNLITSAMGKPVLIDPAVYFGNREAELAFTTLFGGFPEKFYSVYNEICPLQPGFGERIDIYNLYPLIVHVNLFGGFYLNQVRSILKRYT
ncbi:MAG: fructosamine kinase family protein [Cytophagaceae bacterium]